VTGVQTCALPISTTKGQSGPTSRQCRPCWYQMPGAEGARWGSLARIGLPEAVCSPETTQELDPMPSPAPSGCGTACSAARAASIEGSAGVLPAPCWAAQGEEVPKGTARACAAAEV